MNADQEHLEKSGVDIQHKMHDTVITLRDNR
jgi:hypothetical protein